MEDIKSCFIPYQKISFWGALANVKLTGISVECQVDDFKENHYFVNGFSVLMFLSV